MAIDLTIGKFITTAAQKDFARDNLFRVMSLSCRNLTLSKEDLVYCKGGKIPGRETPVDTVKYMGMEMPYTQSTVKYTGNTDYELTFYVDANSSLMQKFERASRQAFNDLTSTGQWQFPSVTDTLTVAALDFNLDPIEYITFYGVSFVKFDEMKFDSAEGEGKKIECTCHISYIYYKRTGSDTVYAGTNA